MKIAYYDESGDDGYPAYSSPLFVLSTLYLHYLNWQQTFEAIRDFRRDIRERFGLPVKTELHTKNFILNKKPYRSLNLSESDRLNILDLFCDLVGNLEVKIINVVIVKPRILNPGYEILDTALKYSVQRIENDLDPARNPQAKFLIITDPGRVGKMRKTTRKIQRINFIPSRFSPAAYRREIRSLIEDPLPKDSKESYFIQLADLVAYVVYLYSLDQTGVAEYHGRSPQNLTPARVIGWMNRLKPSLNLLASGRDIFGVVFHPN